MNGLQKHRNAAILLLCFLTLPLLTLARAPYHVKVLTPQMEEVLPGPDVKVHVEVTGLDIRPGCNSLHLMLDNEPFAVKYDLSRPHVFHDVPPGTHTLRVYAANPYHEMIPDTLCIIPFAVEYHDGENRPERGEPMLTYVLPQGEYRGIDCGDIILNFAVSGAPLSRHGYRVQYYVDGRRYILYRPESAHLRDLEAGYHRIRMELVDERGRIVPGPFNSVERTILLSPEKELEKPRPGEQPVLQSIHGPMTGGRPWVARPAKLDPGENAAAADESRISVTAKKIGKHLAVADSGKTLREGKSPEFEEMVSPSQEEHGASAETSKVGERSETSATVVAKKADSETTKASSRSEAVTTNGLKVRRFSLVKKSDTSPTLTTLKAVETSSTHTAYVRKETKLAPQTTRTTESELPSGIADTAPQRTPATPVFTPPMFNRTAPSGSPKAPVSTESPHSPEPSAGRGEEKETTISARSGKIERIIGSPATALNNLEGEDREETTAAIARVLGAPGATLVIEGGK